MAVSPRPPQWIEPLDGDPRLHIVGIQDGFAVTPSDSVNLPSVTRALLVDVEGSVRVTLISGTVLTIPRLAAGMWHPVYATRVHATGTTATGIVGGL